MRRTMLLDEPLHEKMMCLFHPVQKSPWTPCIEIVTTTTAITTKNNWGYLERNSLLCKVHKIRANLCCFCVCPQTCREPPDSLWAEQLCPVCSLRWAPALVKSTLAVLECVLLSSGSPALPECPLCTPTGSIPSTCAHIHRIAVLCTLPRGGYPWSASN